MSTPTFPTEMEAPKAAPVAKPASTGIPTTGTEYVVLALESTGAERWALVDEAVNASSAHDAVRKASQGKAGTYVAIPSRSFKPVAVKVETVQRVTLDDA